MTTDDADPNLALWQRLRNVTSPSDFVEPTAASHAARYADAIVELLVEGGVDQVAMAPAARWMRQAPSGVHRIAGGRDGFLDMVLGRFARRWQRWVTLPPLGGGLPIRLLIWCFALGLRLAMTSTAEPLERGLAEELVQRVEQWFGWSAKDGARGRARSAE